MISMLMIYGVVNDDDDSVDVNADGDDAYADDDADDVDADGDYLQRNVSAKVWRPVM